VSVRSVAGAFDEDGLTSHFIDKNRYQRRVPELIGSGGKLVNGIDWQRWDYVARWRQFSLFLQSRRRWSQDHQLAARTSGWATSRLDLSAF
jgi:hypothetical protein